MTDILSLNEKNVQTVFVTAGVEDFNIDLKARVL